MPWHIQLTSTLGAPVQKRNAMDDSPQPKELAKHLFGDLIRLLSSKFLTFHNLTQIFSKDLQLNVLFCRGGTAPGPPCPHHDALSSADTHLMLASVGLTAHRLHGKQGDCCTQVLPSEGNTSTNHRNLLAESSPEEESFCTCQGSSE